MVPDTAGNTAEALVRSIPMEGKTCLGTGSENEGGPIRMDRFAELFGPPPVLSTEDANAYERLLQGMMHCYAPVDFMQQWLVRQLADNAWEIKRYVRNKPLAIERKFQQLSEAEGKRAKLREQYQQ